jgi:hypothetical protein
LRLGGEGEEQKGDRKGALEAVGENRRKGKNHVEVGRGETGVRRRKRRLEKAGYDGEGDTEGT